MAESNCTKCDCLESLRLGEYKFLQNLCNLHQDDKICSFDFTELIKEFSGFSKTPEWLKAKLINKGIDINEY